MEEIKAEQPKLTEEKQRTVDTIKEELSTVVDMALIEQVIKNNFVEFEFDGATYKINKPNFEQKQEAYGERVKKFTELLGNAKYILEKDLKKIFLTRGIDLDALTTKITILEREKENYQMKLGKALEDKAPETECELFKAEITKIRDEQQKLSIEKQMYLEFSLENQVLVYMYNYLTYLLALKKSGDAWVRVWNSYPEFLQSNEKLVNKCAFYTTLIVRDEFML